MTHKQRLAALIAAGAKATGGDWLAYLTTHGDPYLCSDADAPLSNQIAKVDTRPDDYGKANNEFLAQAANARDTIALAAKCMEALAEIYERERIDWIAAVTRDYDADHAEKCWPTSGIHETGMADAHEALRQWEGE